jgi:glycosyltransferase involved in cell wall biosynthesis
MMAFILKIPTENSKGVISFTNLEEGDLGRLHNDFLTKLKKHWFFVMHPNYHIKKYVDTGLFDAFITTNELFGVDESSKHKIAGFRCFDFCPVEFNDNLNSKKNYDVIAVSRVQPDKNIDGFFKIIRSLFDHSQSITALLVVSVPGIRPFANNKIRSAYKKMFSESERGRFELITLDYDIPFSLSRRTLATLYGAAKLYLCTHLIEKNHARVISYAHAAGLPIVCFPNIAEGAPHEISAPPFYYIGQSEDGLAKNVITALDDLSSVENRLKLKKLSGQFFAVNRFNQLKISLSRILGADDLNWRFRNDLDIRLAKHHHGVITGNTYFASIQEFLEEILSGYHLFDEDVIDLYVYEKSSYLNRILKKIKYKKYLIERAIKSYIYNKFLRKP